MEKLYLTILEIDKEVVVSLSILSNTLWDLNITNELIEIINIRHISAFDMLTIINNFRFVINYICDEYDNLVCKSKEKLLSSLNNRFGDKFDQLEFQDISYSSKENTTVFTRKSVDLFFE